MNPNENPTGGMQTPETRDDALFEALGKSKRNRKRKLLRRILLLVILIAVCLTAGVSILQRRVRQQFASREDEVLSYAATTGSISTVVSGSGTLQNVDTEAVSVPEGVEVTRLLVASGDAVTEGDLLAAVDMTTVRTAMAQMQERIGELDEAISEAEDDTVASHIYAGVSGRVKAVYGQLGASVADTMVEHGALAVLSLDGYMALDLETDALQEGQTVTVLRPEGQTLDGLVESVIGGTATVLVTDNGPLLDEEVTVLSASGESLGTAKLSVHDPLAVTGFAGTVNYVNAYENQKVHASTSLFTLKDTSTAASYDTLLRQRSEAEETLLELLKLQKSGGVPASISGSVFSVTEPQGGETAVAVLSPDVSMSVTVTVDESDILSLELGQKADVTVSSVSEDPFTGTVTQIDTTAASGYYTAVITLDKMPGMLSGMTAGVDVRIRGVEDAIIIPVEALHQTGSGAYVYTSYDEETQEYGGRVDVVTGLSNNNYVQIRSGLEIGDTVYYTEEQSLMDMFGGMGFGGRGDQNPGGDFGGQMPGGERPDFGGERPQMPGGNRG